MYTLEVEGRLFSGCAHSKKNAKFNCAINAINGLQESGAMLEERLEMAKLVGWWSFLGVVWFWGGGGGFVWLVGWYFYGVGGGSRCGVSFIGVGVDF